MDPIGITFAKKKVEPTGFTQNNTRLSAINVMSLVGLLGASVSSMFYASKLSCGGYFPAQTASTYETANSTYRSRHSAPVRLSKDFQKSC